MSLQKFKLIIFLLLLPNLSFAAPYFGATVYGALVTKEPPSLRGYQVMLSYDPDRYKWRRFNVYFDGGYSHFWITTTPYNTTMSIYSIAPVVRYTFRRHCGPIRPYLELSIGLAYLNHTRFDDRNLGIHFSFQDRAGIGVFVGTTRQLSVGILAVHYSNAHLSSHNSGISIPLELAVGYRFQ